MSLPSSPNDRWRRICVLLAMLTAMSAQLQAASWVVQVGGSGRLAFNPQTLTIQPGDTVRFANLGGYHNVMADDGSFRCARGCDNDGNGGNGSASTQIWSATVAFPDPGQFGYFCEPHGSPGEGMYGTIIVQGPALPVGVQGWTYAALLAALLLITAAFRLRGSALARSIDQARKPI
ncbi:MAG: plastocyanin/azurin family copper-binding protein [Pseudomonadota bacterium]|nr:plastocyanin/azurin family copper-binding protein [Pseudomonadota bacterium]